MWTWLQTMKSLDNSKANKIASESAINNFGGKKGDWKGLIFFQPFSSSQAENVW